MERENLKTHVTSTWTATLKKGGTKFFCANANLEYCDSARGPGLGGEPYSQLCA